MILGTSADWQPAVWWLPEWAYRILDAKGVDLRRFRSYGP